MSRIWRALMFAAGAAALSVAALFAAFASDGSLRLEMDRDLPRVAVHGFYPPERVGDETFAWTADRAGLRLAGFDRRRSWSCELRFRGGRADPSTLPEVRIDVDGSTVSSVDALNEYAVARFEVPAAAERDRLALTFLASTTFVPGPGDQRSLGIMVDRLACAPAGSVRPSNRALWHVAVAAAVFGAAVAIAGVPSGVAALVLLMIAVGQALLLSAGLAPYGRYSSAVLRAGVWLSAVSAAIIAALRTLRTPSLSNTAAGVIVLSAALLFLDVLGLLHPSKPIVDAVFHAHRLEWVIAGRYFFTQPLPSGVSFPYAIGLYVFAIPWTSLTSDYVSLLRIIVSSADVAAGGLLYLLVVKTWRDPLAGFLAVLLYHCVPLPFVILGNANLANVFGQAVALATIVVLALSPAERRQVLFWPAAFLLCALAFLSHISTFVQLAFTLGVLGGLFWWRGGAELKRPAVRIVLGTVITALIALGLYYGRFVDVYRTAWNARVQATNAAPVPSTDAQVQPATVPLHHRLTNGLKSSAHVVGWPVVALAAIGCWPLWRSRVRDRLSLTVAALAVTYGTFLLVGTLSPVDRSLERYADEFVGRVVLATFPGAVILAAIGASWAWRAGTLARVFSGLVLVAAFAMGVRHWMAWFR